MRRIINMSRVIDKNELNNPRYVLDSVTEYKIGHTTYTVKVYFDLERKESLEDIVQRLITQAVEKAISEELSNKLSC